LDDAVGVVYELGLETELDWDAEAPPLADRAGVGVVQTSPTG
jgi:hypothetical protein